MDKKNATIKITENQVVIKTIKTQKRRLIRVLERRNLFQRKRVLKNVKVLVMAYYHYVTENWSFRTLSSYMATKYGVKMSDTAWRKQFLKTSEAFLEAVIEITQSHISKEEPEIYALDASDLGMEGGNSSFVRVHTCYGLNNPNIFSKITDIHTAESVSNFPIQRGAVHIADRGYGRTKQAAYMIDHQADFIFRISPSQVRLYRDEKCKQRLNFAELTRQNAVDTRCYFKCDGKIYSARLIGEKLPEEHHENAEKKYVGSPGESIISYRKVRLNTRNGCFC